MAMVLTVLEARVAPERDAALQTAYRDAAQGTLPPASSRARYARHDNSALTIDGLRPYGRATPSKVAVNNPNRN